MIIRYYHPFQFHMKHDINLNLDPFERSQLDLYLSTYIDQYFQVLLKNINWQFYVFISNIDFRYRLPDIDRLLNPPFLTLHWKYKW